MVIFELGILLNSVELVNKQYYYEYNTKISPALRGGFLSALNLFVEEAFSDEIESFMMKNFKLVMLNRIIGELRDKRITIYCIGDKTLSLKFARMALTKVIDEFLDKYDNLKNFEGEVSPFSEFIQIIDNILGDLTKKPDERFRTIFE